MAALLALGLALSLAPATANASQQATWPLISGQVMTSNGGMCALGFNARQGTNRYIITSGQCAAAGSSWSGVGGFIGTSAGSSFPGNDYGLIHVTSPDALSTALVDRYSAGPDVTIAGFTTPPVGSTVCYSSPAAGWRCGTVTAVNQTVCYPGGCVTGLMRTSMCPETGIAGAPVVTNPGAGGAVRAVGIAVGGSGNCTSGGTTWVQPVAEPLAAYGLTLYTG
jgi:hypothetical protein